MFVKFQEEEKWNYETKRNYAKQIKMSKLLSIRTH